MSKSAQKSGNLKQMRPKLQNLPTDVENNHIDRLAGDVGTPEADNPKPRADDQQHNEFQAEIHKQSDDEDDWGNFDESDKARENLMTYETK